MRKWFFNLAVKDEELLAEQRVFGDEVGFAECEVCRGTENNRIMGRLGEMEEGLVKAGDEIAEQLGQPMEEGGHVE